jgi:hypothetical protein
MAATTDAMSEPTITRVPCTMCPDPCPEDDYLITGINSYGDEIYRRVHHRSRRCWLIQTDGLREEWIECHSLRGVQDHLEF